MGREGLDGRGGRPEAAFASSVALAPKEQAAAKERMLAGTPAKLSQGSEPSRSVNKIGSGREAHRDKQGPTLLASRLVED
jgi:hypothetical protein